MYLLIILSWLLRADKQDFWKWINPLIESSQYIISWFEVAATWKGKFVGQAIEKICEWTRNRDWSESWSRQLVPRKRTQTSWLMKFTSKPLLSCSSWIKNCEETWHSVCLTNKFPLSKGYQLIKSWTS